MAKIKKFVKLGPKAASFADPFSRFKIHKGEVKELVTPQERSSGRIKMALNGGHLLMATAKEFEEYQESLEETVSGKPRKITLEDELVEKTKAELVEYYQDNYEVEEMEVEAFKKLKHSEMVAELVELDKESKKQEDKE